MAFYYLRDMRDETTCPEQQLCQAHEECFKTWRARARIPLPYSLCTCTGITTSQHKGKLLCPKDIQPLRGTACLLHHGAVPKPPAPRPGMFALRQGPVCVSVLPWMCHKNWSEPTVLPPTCSTETKPNQQNKETPQTIIFISSITKWLDQILLYLSKVLYLFWHLLLHGWE